MLPEICDFVEKTYIRKDLAGFTGDPEFVRTARNWKFMHDFLGASAVFSKSRTSIARVYWARGRSASAVEERMRLLNEADFAFRQAFVLCPYQSSVLENWLEFLCEQGRLNDAVLVARTVGDFNRGDQGLQTWVKNIERLASEGVARKQTNSPATTSPTADSP